MRLKKLAVALVLLAVPGALSACGIGPGPVVTHGKAPTGGEQQFPYSTEDLQRPDNLRDPVDLVRRYLLAAADKPATQLDTLRSYMQDKSWSPPKDELNIYRVPEDPVSEGQRGDTTQVSVMAQKVGVLRAGRIEADVNYEAPAPLLFTVVTNPSSGAFIERAPSGLILSDSMLNSTRYQLRPVYYWDSLEKRLIPDLRYLPSDLREEEKAKKLIDYLFGPPSPWLLRAVKQTPGLGPLRIPVHNPDGTMTIDLPNQLSETELALLAAQLKQTLVGGAVTGIQFKIQGVPVEASTLALANDSKPAARFGVQQGKVVRLDFTPDKTAVPLSPEVNAEVEWAVFSRGEGSVAMSRIVNNARQFLIGPSGAPRPVSVGGKPVEQAAWLDGESRAALVLSDRKLYEVVPGADSPRQLFGPVPGPVTSFSVVPDGRIALVVDGKLHMAALYHNGEALTITQPLQVPTALDQVQHVALSRFAAIIAGVGAGQKPVVTQINVDGALQLRAWQGYAAGEQISRLVTDFRTGATSTGPAYYDYKGEAYRVSPGGATQFQNLIGPPSGASPPPSTPSAPKITAVSFEG